MNIDDRFAARCTRTWVLLYTRRLSAKAREDRCAEIESDVWEQLDDAGSANAGLTVLGRCVRGIPADLWWRYHTLRDERSVRARSVTMAPTVKGGWWRVLVIVAACGGVAERTAPLLVGASDGAPAVASAVIGVAWACVMLVGLRVARAHPVAGSWLIAIGNVATLASVLLPLGVAVLAGGMWTGALVFRQPDVSASTPSIRREHVRGAWLRWLVVAVALTAFGFGVAVAGERLLEPNVDENSIAGTAVWALWLLSWLAAFVTACVGVVLGILRFVDRHHTRPA